MYIFSTLGNKEIESRILSALPDGIEFVDELTEDCEAAFLAARSLSAGAGVKNVREWLDKVVEKGIPCLLIARDEALIDLAKERGIPEENIINGARISIREIVQKLRDVVCADDYEIIFDDDDYSIDLNEASDEGRVQERLEPQRREYGFYENESHEGEGRESSWPGGFAYIEPVSVEQVLPSDINETGRAGGKGYVPVPGANTPDTAGLVSPVAFVGVKGGVGTSTVAAMACDTLDGGLHLEIAGAGRLPSAYCYYGRDPESTRENYVFWDLSKGRPPLGDHRVVILDISSSVPVEAADVLIDAVGCLVLVTDRSEIAFELTGRMLRAGFKPDILVVNAAISGVGNGMEVYLGEYEDLLQGVQVLELSGGLDEEKAIARAQRNGESPCGGGRSVSLDTFAGELTSAIRGVLGI
ncbi:hypothetical protein GFC01_02040 [Desulfofundulus thermobenzoicus]|uniref:Uncharacterized protein n=1 Tax=Desulfofundulus thermobenzoicus TaxID=29376 RepID=A0A6N7IN92_9FIRM|nr:hypothetical protein [Desulfofundulus thermobenzoicus]MQL51069.1 hypothetical protein [Desulfofundulus thermobenzoicus]